MQVLYAQNTSGSLWTDEISHSLRPKNSMSNVALQEDATVETVDWSVVAWPDWQLEVWQVADVERIKERAFVVHEVHRAPGEWNFK